MPFLNGDTWRSIMRNVVHCLKQNHLKGDDSNHNPITAQHAQHAQGNLEEVYSMKASNPGDARGLCSRKSAVTIATQTEAFAPMSTASAQFSAVFPCLSG